MNKSNFEIQSSIFLCQIAKVIFAVRSKNTTPLHLAAPFPGCERVCNKHLLQLSD